MFIALVAAVLAAATLSACGGSSSKSGGSSNTASASSTTTSAADAGVSHAQQVVAKYANPVSNYSTPTAAIHGLASLKGKTVMYLPLLQAVPAFAITAAGIKEALSHLGIKVTICNGQANPTGVAACLAQAASQRYAGVITDSIPYGLAAHAFAATEAKGIPVLITDQLAQPGTAARNKLAYMEGDVNVPTLVADWIIADSKGKANVIVGEEADSPSAIAYITQGVLPEFKKYCSGCTVKTIKIPLDPTQTASTVSTALNSTPNAAYYDGEFEDELQGAMQGVQQANKTNTLKVEFSTATIAGLTKMKQGESIYAEGGVDVNYQGWADADDLLRMLAHQPVVHENIPERIFTRQNVKSIAVTPAAQASGVWYGNAAFKQDFLKLWQSNG